MLSLRKFCFCQHSYSEQINSKHTSLLLIVLLYGYSSNSQFSIVQLHWSHLLSRKTHTRKRVHALYAYTYTTEGDQVDAHNDFTGWAAVSLSPGTYAADFYGRSIPIYVPRTSLPSRDTRANRRRRHCVTPVSRRGIISAHCHRLIEFGTDRSNLPLVNRPNVHV